MSVLSDRTIKELIGVAHLVRRPSFQQVAVQPCSVDVHLDSISNIDGMRITGSEWREVTPSAGTFLLGCTEETFQMPENVVGLVVGKSGVGRAGLAVEFAGLVDPGFHGQVTLELKNLLDYTGMTLRRGMRIAQVMFMWLDHPADTLYGSVGAGSHYQNQEGPTPSHLLHRPY